MVAGFIILIVTIVMSIVGLNTHTSKHGTCIHCGLGVIVMIAVGVICLSGIIAKYMLNYVEWRTRITLAFKFLHAVSLNFK